MSWAFLKIGINLVCVKEREYAMQGNNRFFKRTRNCVCLYAKSLQWCLTLCDPMDHIASQAPLSVGLSRQEYWSGFPCPPQGDLPNPGTEPASLMSPALAGRFFITSITWEAVRNCEM